MPSKKPTRRRKKLLASRKKKKLFLRKIKVVSCAFLCVTLPTAFIIFLTRHYASEAQTTAPSVQPAASAATFLPSATPTLSPTPEPTPKGRLEVGNIYEASSPDFPAFGLKQRIYANGEQVDTYIRPKVLCMGPGEEYAQVEGILTFRGNNYRENAAYGKIPDNPSSLSVQWRVKVGSIDEWSGVGWTGQGAAVKWPDETRKIMNIHPEKREKEGLVEIIYAALDGKIRFLDIEDGEPTRGAIDIGAPIKGSVSVDPRGIPLLYCGQGIPTANGRSVKIGMRIFSLLDQKMLFFLDGRDPLRTRNWYAFDASPLVDAQTDTLLQVSENGLFYSIDLNTRYDPGAGTLSVDPIVDRYAYKSSITERPGIENSLAVYNHYGYFVDNSGLLQCIDLNALRCVWAYDCKDDTDATCALEESDAGEVALYTACEMDMRGTKGDIYIRRFDALTGEQQWVVNVATSSPSSINGGAFGSPAIGKEALGELVYFNIARTKEKGTLFALDKRTGETVWSRGLGAYSWSSPVLVYAENGRGYIVIGNSEGILALLDGLSGEMIAKADLGSNIESSPMVYRDMIVIGTRGGRIYGVKIT